MFKRGLPSGERGFSRIGILTVATVILVLVAVVVSLFVAGSSHKSLKFDTAYQAVLLSMETFISVGLKIMGADFQC